MMMKIRIETEKVIANPGNDSKGHRMRRIMNIEALRENELPKEYLKEPPFCYLSAGGSHLYLHESGVNKRGRVLLLGTCLEEQEFQEVWKVIKQAGERLHEINSRWSGKEVFKT
jgi:hypothetical protein